MSQVRRRNQATKRTSSTVLSSVELHSLRDASYGFTHTHLWLPLAEKDSKWIPTLMSFTSFTLTLKTPQPPYPLKARAWSYSSVWNPAFILCLPAKQDHSDINPTHTLSPTWLKSIWNISTFKTVLGKTLRQFSLWRLIFPFLLRISSPFSLIKWIGFFYPWDTHTTTQTVRQNQDFYNLIRNCMSPIWSGNKSL